MTGKIIFALLLFPILTYADTSRSSPQPFRFHCYTNRKTDGFVTTTGFRTCNNKTVVPEEKEEMCMIFAKCVPLTADVMIKTLKKAIDIGDTLKTDFTKMKPAQIDAFFKKATLKDLDEEMLKLKPDQVDSDMKLWIDEGPNPTDPASDPSVNSFITCPKKPGKACDPLEKCQTDLYYGLKYFKPEGTETSRAPAGPADETEP